MRVARPLIHVVAGVLADARGRILITQRPPGKLLAGSWEFPGGKRAAGESRLDALCREILEELDLVVEQARPLIRYRHDYPELSVDLDVWRVRTWRGEPRGLECQAIEWVLPSELIAHDLLPADRPITVALQLPERCLITGAFGTPGEFDRRLAAALRAGIRLVQLRVPDAGVAMTEMLARRASGLCRQYGASLLINGEPAAAARIATAVGAEGVHLPSRYLSREIAGLVPDGGLVGVSCHDRRQLSDAVEMGADFATLSPVLATASHPGAPYLGWDRFRDLVAELPLPVYALGGMEERHLEAAWQSGAVGIAGISAFW
jgi:8-oxo-dGTP diphosphatase